MSKKRKMKPYTIVRSINGTSEGSWTVSTIYSKKTCKTDTEKKRGQIKIWI